MPTVKICKARAGSSSHGHTWPTDGAVVEVPYEDACELLRIPDGGFTEAPAEAASDEVPEEDSPEFSEAPPPVAPRPRGRPRKVSADEAPPTEVTE